MTTSTARVGSEYAATQHLDIAEIAKLLRKRIAAAKKAGEISAEFKYSVRIDRYSMGQAMHVYVLGAPAEYLAPLRSEDYWTRQECDARKLLDTLEAMAEAYNRDDSDSMVDHFDVRYYSHVQFS